jgi:prevent-host-death family protein
MSTFLIDHYHDHGQNSGHLVPPGAAMTTIQASEFKAKCLGLMDQVARTGETIVVTKNGKPIVELRPHRPPRAKSLIGIHKGKMKITGDLVAPLGKSLWKALK